MSRALPNCKVCLHSSAKEIDALIRQGTALAAITRRVNGRRAMTLRHRPDEGDLMPALSFNMLSAHRDVCVSPIPPIDRVGDAAVGEPADPSLSVSAAELADPKRRLGWLREALASKLGALSGDKLYQLYMAELRLQTAKAGGAAKSDALGPDQLKPDDDADLDDAISAARGRQSTIVRMRKRRTL